MPPTIDNKLRINASRSNNPLPFYFYIALVIFTLVCMINGTLDIKLGRLYDCSRVYHTALYKFDNHMNCKHHMHLSDSRIKHFTAKVWQFSPKRTDFPIYHCTAQRLRMTCHESFFGHKSKHRWLSLVPVSRYECQRAMLTHSTRYGKLHIHSQGEWHTSSPDKYSCSWMKTKSRTYTHFKMVAYPAQLRGSDHLISQRVTNTHCNY